MRLFIVLTPKGLGFLDASSHSDRCVFCCHMRHFLRVNCLYAFSFEANCSELFGVIFNAAIACLHSRSYHDWSTLREGFLLG